MPMVMSCRFNARLFVALHQLNMLISVSSMPHLQLRWLIVASKINKNNFNQRSQLHHCAPRFLLSASPGRLLLAFFEDCCRLPLGAIVLCLLLRMVDCCSHSLLLSSLSSDCCCSIIRLIAAWETRNNASPWGWLLCAIVLCLCWWQDQPSTTILGSTL